MDVKGLKVLGVDVDAETRCKHYHTQRDVIAIKFKCCDIYYSCFECHNEVASHSPEVWEKSEQATKAVLCGVCGHELTIQEYLDSHSTCLNCDANFNPGCRNHSHLYFSDGINRNINKMRQ